MLSHGALRCAEKQLLMRNAKSAKKTKMADEGRVSVNSKQTVLRIHEKLKKEVHQIAEKKSWTAEQKNEFEKKLLEVGSCR